MEVCNSSLSEGKGLGHLQQEVGCSLRRWEWENANMGVFRSLAAFGVRVRSVRRECVLIPTPKPDFHPSKLMEKGGLSPGVT